MNYRDEIIRLIDNVDEDILRFVFIILLDVLDLKNNPGGDSTT